MKKSLVKVAEPVRGRVLARVLAEDLRNVRGGVVLSAGATTTVTEGERRDITNVGGDGDTY